ncbi:MAG: preprotein translocase subunit YajC [Planctomycetota bacterium]|jgi:preprotein translocase subunit YajC
MPSTTLLIPFLPTAALPTAAPVAALPGEQEPTAPPTAPTSPTGPAPVTAAGSTAPGAPTGQQAAPPCGGNEFLWIAGAFALVYFLMIRPQQKQQKELMALLAAVKVGDRVVTRDGLHGQIAKLTEKTVTLQVDSVQLTYDRTSIARVERNEAATPDAKKS